MCFGPLLKCLNICSPDDMELHFVFICSPDQIELQFVFIISVCSLIFVGGLQVSEQLGPSIGITAWASYPKHKMRIAHAPGAFPLPPRVSNPDVHHGTCVTHVPWCIPGWLTSDFLWSRWRGKRSRHSRRIRNPQFYVSGRRSMPRIPVAPLLTLLDFNPSMDKWLHAL